MNRYNFLVDEGMGKGKRLKVTPIDFENAGPYGESAAKKELDDFAEQLKEETWRGGPAVPI